MTAPTLPNRVTLPLLAAAIGFLLAFAVGTATRSAERRAAGPRLAHMVFFSLKDRTPETRETFVASCHKYLSEHEGSEAFEVGVIAEDVIEPGVSVRDFDVALHVVFASKEAEAKYLKSPRHLKFVDENKGLWSQVRVFDSYLTRP